LPTCRMAATAVHVEGSTETAASRLSQQKESATVDCVEVQPRRLAMLKQAKLGAQGSIDYESRLCRLCPRTAGLSNSERHLCQKEDGTAQLTLI
jgi:hypothetical protein